MSQLAVPPVATSGLEALLAEMATAEPGARTQLLDQLGVGSLAEATDRVDELLALERHLRRLEAAHEALPQEVRAAEYAEALRLDAGARTSFLADLEAVHDGALAVADALGAADRPGPAIEVARLTQHLAAIRTRVLPPAAAGEERLWAIDEVLAEPEVPALIAGVLPGQSITVVVGKKSSFKTFVLVDMGMRLAAGLPWQGRACRPTLTVYNPAEGRGGIKRRLAAWRSRYGRQPLEPLILPRTQQFLEPGMPARLIRTLRHAWGDRIRSEPVVLIVDTLHRSVGGDENSSETANRVYAAVDRLRDEIPHLTVVFIAHPPRGGRAARGTTAWEDDADCVIYVERAEGSHTVTLECGKQKDDVEFPPLTLEVEPEGNSLVVAESAGAWAVTDTRQLKAGEREALQVLADFHPEAVSWTRWLGASGIPESSLARHRKTLLALGYLEGVEVGKRGKQTLYQYRATGAGIAASIPTEPILRLGSQLSLNSHPAPMAAGSGSHHPGGTTKSPRWEPGAGADDTLSSQQEPDSLEVVS